MTQAASTATEARTEGDAVSAVLFVVVPHWAPSRASVHPDPVAAVRAATQESEGCRVLVIHPETGRWKEWDISQPINPDDPGRLRERQRLELSRLGRNLLADVRAGRRHVQAVPVVPSQSDRNQR